MLKQIQDRKFKIHCLISWTYFFFQNLAIFNSKCEITKITGHQVCCRRVHIHRVGSAAKLYKNTHTTEPKYKRNICNYTMPLRLGYLWSLSQTKIKGVFSFCDILRNQPRDYRQKSQKWYVVSKIVLINYLILWSRKTLRMKQGWQFTKFWNH